MSFELSSRRNHPCRHVPAPEGLIRGRVSPTYSQKEPALSLAVEAEGPLPIRFVTVMDFGGSEAADMSPAGVSFGGESPWRVHLKPPGETTTAHLDSPPEVGMKPVSKHLLLIHQAFASPAQGGGTRHYELGRHLLSRGHKFSVVSSNLSYLSGKPILERHGLFVEQDIDGLRVLRAYAYPALHRSFAWRIFSFLTFTVSSLLAGLRCGPIDLVMGTSPPIFQAFSAWMFAFLRRKPFLLEVRDLWPEFAIDMGVLRNPALIWLSRRLERLLYARATHILVNSPAYRDYLLKLGVAPLKVSLIANGVDPAMFDPASLGQATRQKWGLQDKFVVTYTGAIGMANDLGMLLRAASRLREYSDIVFLIAGDGKERANLEAQSRELDLKNTVFTGTVSKAEVADMMASSNACAAILQNIPMFRTTYPNKVFDYMAAGRPTLLAIDGAIREVIESSHGGIFVQPGDDEALTRAILRLRANPEEAHRMGELAHEYVTEHFNRQHQAEQFVSLVEGMAGNNKDAKEGRFYRGAGKRIFDLLLTVPAALLFAPVMLALGLLIKVNSSGPAFFKQERLGKQGRIFEAYKFRTMTHRVRTNHVEIRADNPEVTPVGRLLRRLSWMSSRRS